MEEVNDVQQVWMQLCNTYNSDLNRAETTYSGIVKSYSQPQRAYHTLDHVNELITFINTSGDVKVKSMLLFTAFFHDVVYDPGSSSNETESAAIARDAMQQLLVPQEIIEDTVHLILLTKSHANVDRSAITYDMLLFLDMDLAILGATEERYKQYAAQIRKEFKKYPDLLYNNGRRKFLEAQLKLPLIFHTQLFREKYEVQARINMINELNYLL
jgi:predicted metal-dependent HD superfamily phosphohydrolase